jgi:hypothetical protein
MYTDIVLQIMGIGRGVHTCEAVRHDAMRFFTRLNSPSLVPLGLHTCGAARCGMMQHNAVCESGRPQILLQYISGPNHRPCEGSGSDIPIVT